MASWTDGPEYAPLERPAAFAAPSARPLDDAPPLTDLSYGAPTVAPTAFEEPRDRVPALTSLVPAVEAGRDPNQPFHVDSAVMTAGSAWGYAHSAATSTAADWQPPVSAGWTADQPYASTYAPPAPATGFPGPGTPEWFGPGQEWGPPEPPPPATLANTATAATYGLLVVLAVGGLVSLLSPFLLAVALALTSQVRYRRRQIRRAFLVALGISLAAGVIPILDGRGVGGVMDTIGLVALLSCWVMLVVVLFLQYSALSSGERPET